MKIIYCSKPSLVSWLIRIFTWSRFSHTAIVEDDVYIIDSTMTHGGVQRRRLAEIIEEYPTLVIVDVAVEDETKALEFARSQLGKPYDWTAIVGFIMRRDWADESDWFCSELAEASITAGGRVRFRESLSRITPEISWAVV